MKVYTAVKMAHYLLQEKLATANCAVDATAGNGNDTLFLARYLPPEAHVYAFDIQQTALDKTSQLLTINGLLHKVDLILDSHANMKNYILAPADIIMFNLGYLPGAQRCVTTMTEATLAAVATSMDMLAVGGIITIAAYPGHHEGRRELDALHEFLQGVSQTSYTIANWRMVNQINYPPVLYVIEKLRGECT